MLIFQAFKIGPELEEVKKRVDELQAVVNGFAEAILEGEYEDLIEEAMTADHQDAKYVWTFRVSYIESSCYGMTWGMSQEQNSLKRK